jgi:hypothetical protein
VPYSNQEVMLCTMVGPGLIDPSRGIDANGKLIRPGFCCLGIVRKEEVKAAKKRFMEQMAPYFEDQMITPYHIYELPVCEWAPMPPDSGIVRNIYSQKDIREVANMEHNSRIKDKEDHERRVEEVRVRRKQKMEEFKEKHGRDSEASKLFEKKGFIAL